MEKLVITGGKKLHGITSVSGAKNAALKALVAACLTSDPVTIHNIPLISDFFAMVEILRGIGAEVVIKDHSIVITMKDFKTTTLSLDQAARARTSAMFMAPLLARTGEATIPNPGGCRLGARPVDRIIDGLTHLGAKIQYDSKDGYFYAKTSRAKGATYHFEKNTHMGTETMILAAVLAEGTTVLTNAAEEPEIDDLISLLNSMGGDITRTNKREITINGVEKLHGGEFTISPDRNEIVTFAIGAYVTGGDVTVKDATKVDLTAFLETLTKIGASFTISGDDIRFFADKPLVATDIVATIHPGFMTDWQAPMAVLLTQAKGTSTIHETVFEYKFGYVKDLKKMGAQIQFFNPPVSDPDSVYNFNKEDDDPSFFHAIKIDGPTPLHNAVLTTIDIRAGAAVVLAALAAKGTSTIFGLEKLDRGYEAFESRLAKLGALIERRKEE